MKIACLGGGPGGLYFAISMKLRNPSTEVVVFERNRPDDTFGWGIRCPSRSAFNAVTVHDITPVLIKTKLFAFLNFPIIVIQDQL